MISLSPYTKLMLQAINENCGNLRGKSALDVGCGRGYLGEALVLLGADVMGIDVQDEAIHVSTRRGVKAMKLDMRDVPIVLGTRWDVVVANLPALRCIGTSGDDGESITYCGGITGRANVFEFLHLLPLIVRPGGYALTVLSSMNDMQRQLNEARMVGKVTIVAAASIPLRDKLYASVSNCRYVGDISYASFLKRMEKLDPPIRGELNANNSYLRGEGQEHLQVIKVEVSHA
jgi:SAM-dependent methyltransferase